MLWIQEEYLYVEEKLQIPSDASGVVRDNDRCGCRHAATGGHLTGSVKRIFEEHLVDAPHRTFVGAFKAELSRLRKQRSALDRQVHKDLTKVNTGIKRCLKFITEGDGDPGLVRDELRALETRKRDLERTLAATEDDRTVEESIGETLTHYAFPDSHWIKIRTNNPLERIMKEIRRRTRVVGAFPDGQNCLNPAAARLRHIAGSKWSTRKYINMAPLYAEQTSSTGAVA